MQLHIKNIFHIKLYAFTYNFIYLYCNYMQKHIKNTTNHENTSRFCKRKKK